MKDYTEKPRGSLLARLDMKSILTGKASEKDAGKALIIAYTIASLGLAVLLGAVGLGIMFWLMN